MLPDGIRNNFFSEKIVVASRITPKTFRSATSLMLKCKPHAESGA
jgi:hypothetical protein